ncbi:MAG: hypothetical protein CSA70_11985 [Rhodobacterales bacterium]|nr:MAG: hypothetical protein CSA70_11985 [Rhodobacterales bacterium]
MRRFLIPFVVVQAGRWRDGATVFTRPAGAVCGCARGRDVSKCGRAAIEAKGAELRFLPPYAPDLNLIEQVFAKIKGIVRSLAPRCFDTLCDAIKTALNA